MHALLGKLHAGHSTSRLFAGKRSSVATQVDQEQMHRHVESADLDLLV